MISKSKLLDILFVLKNFRISDDCRQLEIEIENAVGDVENEILRDTSFPGMLMGPLQDTYEKYGLLTAVRFWRAVTGEALIDCKKNVEGHADLGNWIKPK